MSDTLDRLRSLQAEASNLDETERRLNTKPEDFAEIDRRYQQSREQIESLSARLEELARVRRDVDGDLAAEQEQLKKYQGQLMQVKNQQQYAAAWKEIDTVRKKIKELEDDSLRRMGEVEEADTQLSALRSEAEPLESEHQTAYKAWQGSLGGLRKQSAAIKAKMEAAESGLPIPVRREFHAIYKQRQGVAVATVQEGSCSSCRTRIRPQVVQQLKRGEMARCEGCRRFLVP